MCSYQGPFHDYNCDECEPQEPQAWDYGISEDRALKAQAAQAQLIRQGAYTFACQFDTGKFHGPFAEGFRDRRYTVAS